MGLVNLDDAIDVVARTVLARVAYDADWEMYPDIGEHDWRRVQARVAALTKVPATVDFDRAYALLTARASADGTVAAVLYQAHLADAPGDAG
jgi:hypothetical protein